LVSKNGMFEGIHAPDKSGPQELRAEGDVVAYGGFYLRYGGKPVQGGGTERRSEGWGYAACAEVTLGELREKGKGRRAGKHS